VIRRGLASLATIALVGACSPGPIPASAPQSLASTASASESILALVGSVGAMSLVAPALGSGSDLVPIPAHGLPPDGAWLSDDGAMSLLTTLDGGAWLRSGSGPGGWAKAPGDLGGDHPGRAFGSLEPLSPSETGSVAARRVAFVEGDPGSGNPGSLVVELLSGADLRRYALPRAVEAAPAWLPDGWIALIVRNARDQAQVTLLDAATGASSPAGGPPLRSVAVGGALVATVDPDGTVRAGSLEAWPGHQPLRPIALGTAHEVALQAQPSPSGAELSIVVADQNGDAASIRILAAAGGWHEIARFGLPSGANRAVVSWLAVP
jgi:hypothetical protein